MAQNKRDLTRDQLLEMLEHDEDSDIWLLNSDGSTSIVPDQDISAFQNPLTWPKYICRSSAVNDHVATKGVDGAVSFINMIMTLTMMTSGPVETVRTAFSGWRR